MSIDDKSVMYGFNASTVVDDECRTTWDNVKSIRDWLLNEDDAKNRKNVVKIPNLNDEQIVCFLLSCNSNIEQTKNTIKQYYIGRNGAPELFDNRNAVDDPAIIHQLNIVQIGVFPKQTDDGHAIMFHRLQDTCYSNYQMDVAMKILFMTLDITTYERPPKGLIILFDMKGIGLMHLTRTRIGLVKKFCHYLQEGLPVRLKAIHVLNSAYFVEKVIAIIRPFMMKEVMELIHFHPPTLDMNLFYEKCIPKHCLPTDLGGDLPMNTQELHENTKKKLQNMLTFFTAEEEQRKQAQH